jgi:acyl carrier protein
MTVQSRVERSALRQVPLKNIPNISELLCRPFWRDAQAPIMEETALKAQLKQHIIKYLNLLDIKPEDIADAEPLFGENLGLDSIDALELSVLMEREYGLKITDPAEGRKILYDVNSMAAYIIANRQEA